MRRLAGLLGLLLLLAAEAKGAEMASLRAAAIRDDTAAIQRWLAEAAALPGKSADPGTLPRSDATRALASEATADEAAVTAYAFVHALKPSADTKARLLAAIDSAMTARRNAYLEAVREAAATPTISRIEVRTLAGDERWRPLVGTGESKRGLRVRVAYENGREGDVLALEWFTDVGDRLEARESAELVLDGERGNADATLSSGQLGDGAHRLDVTHGGRLVSRVDFAVVEGSIGSSPATAAIAFVPPPPARIPPLAAAPPAPPAAPAPVPTPPVAAASPPPAAAPAQPAPARARPDPMTAEKAARDLQAIQPPTAALIPPKAASRPPAAPAIAVAEALIAKGIKGGAPFKPVTETLTVRRRLVLWARIEVSAPTTLRARWIANDGRFLGEHELAVEAGRSEIAFWLALARDTDLLPKGRIRVDLVHGGSVVKSLSVPVKEGTLFDAWDESMDDIDVELERWRSSRVRG